MLKRLAEVTDSDTSVFGGKAINLGRLCREGFRVPEGCVVSSDILRDSVLQSDRYATSSKILSGSCDIAERIRQSIIDSEVIASIRSVLDELTSDGSSVAVRSSCIYEDSESASFAGIYTSYTDLFDLDSVLQAVKECIASMYSDRALDFALYREIDLRELSMGVIIQKYVPGVFSGVVFTVDTVDMDSQTMIVNVVQGPCSGFVDGTSEPVMIRVDRVSRSVVGCIDTCFAGSKIDPSALIDSLVMQCLDIERLIGSYQDIEWTFFNDELHYLQARPITTYRTKVSPETWDPGDGRVWKLSEYSRALRPLEQEYMERCLTGCRTGAIKTANHGVGPIHVIRCGYIYTRMEDLPDESDHREKWSEYITGLVKEYKNVFEDVLLPEIVARQDELDRFVNRDLDAIDIARFLEKGMAYAEWASEQHWKAVWGNCYLANCGSVPTFADEFPGKLPQFETGEMEDLVYAPTILSELRRSIVRIASEVADDPVLKSLFDGHTSDRVLSAMIDEVENAEPLRRKIAEIVEKYWRYPCSTWRDPTGPVLCERPDAVFGWIRSYRGIRIEDFESTQREIRVHKEELIDRIEQDLDAKDRGHFRNALQLAQKAYRCRDDHAHYLDNTYFVYVRIAALKAGERLAKLGLLRNPRDVWLLRSDEILLALSGGLPSAGSLAGIRAEEHDHNLSILPPSHIGPDADEAQRAGDETSVVAELTGISGLYTKVRGSVRVFRDDSTNLQTAGIFVLPNERAMEITAFLDKIEGIVVERGSPYSHIGIIARELRIPILFGVKGAMKALHDGDLIELDGIAGAVRKLSPEQLS